VDKGFDAGNVERAGLKAAVTVEQLLAVRGALMAVRVEVPVRSYIRQLVAATRSSPRVRLGAGPRAAVHLLLAAKALAVLMGRPFVTPDDVRRLSGPVLRHRLLLSPDAEIDGATPQDVLDEILQSVEVRGDPGAPSARVPPSPRSRRGGAGG
jgi:MoxR-like ATPase